MKREVGGLKEEGGSNEREGGREVEEVDGSRM